MNTRKVITIVVTLLTLASFVLSACGAPAVTEAPAPTEAQQEPAPTEAPEAAPTEAPAVEPTELVYWSMWNESEKQADVIKAAIAEFEGSHPGVTVNVNWAGRDIRKILPPALDGGQSIDIFEADQNWLLGNLAKYLTPLDDYAAQPSYDTEGKSVLETILPATVTFSLDKDGKLTSLPSSPFAVMFFYNKDIFVQAGVDKAPETFAEFIAAGEKVKAAGYDFVTADQDSYMDVWLGYYANRAKSCDFLVETLKDKTGEMWKDPAWEQMAKDLGELSAKGLWSPQASANVSPAGQTEVAIGTAAVYLNGTWFPSEVSSTTGPDFKWGQFAFPAVTADKNNYGDIEAGANALAINANSKNKDLAFELLKIMVSNKYQTMMVETAGVPGVTTVSPWPANLAEGFEVMKSSTNASPWACAYWDAGDVASTVTIPLFKELLFGTLKPEDFIAKMAAEQAKYYNP